jgi:3-phenylpropionate/cinnamic acid dioxygenase small subunit
MLKDRVSALREADIYEPQRYRHLVSSIKIVGDLAEGPEALDLVANFLVLRTMRDGAMTIFGAGRYVDRVANATPAAGNSRRSPSSIVVRSTYCWRSPSDVCTQTAAPGR